MTKHTHTGTCQLCGRNHAVNNATGLLAKHGYTVDWGFFHGVCEGANHLPLQKDRSLLDSTVDQWKEEANKMLALTLADIKKVPVRVRENGIVKTVMMNEAEYIAAHNYADASDFENTAVMHLEYRIYKEAEYLLKHVENMKKQADNLLGTELFEVVRDIKKVVEFDSYKEAYEFSLTLKVEGIKPIIRRVNMREQSHRVHWKITK